MKTVYQTPWQENKEEQQIFYKYNANQEPANEKMFRYIHHLKKKPNKAVDMSIDYPQSQMQLPFNPFSQQILTRQKLRNIYTPNPPKQRNLQEQLSLQFVKKYSKKYQYLWIMIAQSTHPARQKFAQLFPQQRIRGQRTLNNIFLPSQYEKILNITKQSMDIKLLFDYQSFKQTFQAERWKLQDNERVLDVLVECKKFGVRVQASKKIKSISSIEKTIDTRISQEVQKSRKDVPYFNFVHFDSSAELFTRRSIIQDCFYARPQEQLLQNCLDFYQMLVKQTKEREERQVNKLANSNQSIATSNKQRRRIEQKFTKYRQINQSYKQIFTKYLNNYYPINQQTHSIKNKVYNWVITLYCQESVIYSLLNNIIRYSLNKEKVKVLSTLVKYLYDAIRFHFTNRFRDIKYREVYRGSRASLFQQNSFREGKYLQNLGFMSTTRSRSQAFKFKKINVNQSEFDEGLIMIITIPQFALDFDYLQEHQGFWALDKILQIRDKILAHQQEVLFNPLNTFEITKWDSKNKQLYLNYAPQLEIIYKKKKKRPITQKQEDLLKSIYKLKDKDYDKGMMFLQEGDPSAAVTYYENSVNQGESLSINQKAHYIEGLKQIGGIQKIQKILEESIAEQQITKELEHKQSTISTVQSLAISVQTIKMYEQSTEFQRANSKVQKIAQSIKSNVTIASDPEKLLIELKGFIELAHVKFTISQTLASIRACLQSLKILDQMANINFCYKLQSLGKKLRKIKFAKIQSFPILNQVIKQQKYFDIDTKKELQQTMIRIKQIILTDDNLINLTKSIINISQNPLTNKQIGKLQSHAKQEHKKLQNYLNQYLATRNIRTPIQQLQSRMAESYWQLQQISIQSNLGDEEFIKQKQNLKNYRNQMLLIKNAYKKMFEEQKRVYQILYNNIYKTSLSVNACLESNKIFYERYERFIRIQKKNQDISLDLVTMLEKHGQILFQYAQIVERAQNKYLYETPSEKKGEQKIKEAEKILIELQNRHKKKKVFYTHEKAELKNIRAKYLKSKVIQSQQNRITAMKKKQQVVNQQPPVSPTRKKRNNEKKSENFVQLISIIEEKKEIHQRDSNCNQLRFGIKNMSEKVQVVNQSSTIQVENQNYVERLKKIQPEFQSIIDLIHEMNQQEIFQKDMNLCHLYLLMAENQFRLGLIHKSSQYLKKSKESLKKILKEEQSDNFDKLSINLKINKRKLLFGNKTKIGCLKLEAHIVAFFGTKKRKKQLLEDLIGVKRFLDAQMHQPLSQADISESIGLLSANLLMRHKEIQFSLFRDHMLECIKIRQKHLGQNIKQNARILTILMEITCSYENIGFTKQAKSYYIKGHDIYSKIDATRDPMLVIYSTKHQTTRLIYLQENSEACQNFKNGFNYFNSNENKNISLEVTKQIFRGAKLMIKEPKYLKQGIKWMKISLQYLNHIQKFVETNFKGQKLDKQSFNVYNIKLELLHLLIPLQRKYGSKAGKDQLEDQLILLEEHIKK